MAAAVVKHGAGEFDLPPRKKPKVSELPLSSAQRASIDGMLHTFKKKGEFDGLRKKVFQQYNESAQRGMFEAALRTFTTSEIERDPIKYLKPDRRMGAPLLEGAAARSDVYKQTEAGIDAYIDQYLVNAERALRDIRRKEIGDEAAEEETKRGGKSDEAYAAEAVVRRSERAKKHVEQERLRKKQEAQERKKAELAALKKKQEELMKETERLQREQKRRAEREAWKTAEKEREKERIRKFNEERERQKKENEERERALREERARREKERAEREQKRLEEEALKLLLREGEQMAEKSRRPELERSESMEPPPRLRHSAPRNSLSRDQMRAQGLMPTSMTLRRGDRAPGEPREVASATPAADEDRRRVSRVRSPSSARSGRRRESSPAQDERRPAKRDTARRETLYRDISAEREAWKARQRHRDTSRGEEGEVVEQTSTRARSKSRESARNSYRPRRESRSPPRRPHRDSSRSRSPPRFRERRREDSPPRRRERSRSPPGIDRYVPGGSAAAVRRREEDEKAPRRKPDDERDTERRRRPRDDDRPKAVDIDRYIPPGSSGRTDDADRPRRRERSRSREKERHRERSRERDRERGKDKEREKERSGRERPRETDKERRPSSREG
ncbi:hypothetical protein BAUCODRAFT_31937 [Baudoinia panamericana UAMH 10762]|uniref:BOD1/SHG1 domain-containing protein n=1 Tax=Baudoinia panamericana (strain UAMH 10762) TaxID=717646 RepID=M2NG14_BAUPA|nr:uncharacterized protein BAUCODRAFT_31937 [Baudoinia panamericana UAMH 10762]EMC97930.1 hypothetical protein BAUCODRAFT_31937 [Baudoinia panamericana UAMH 10762]